MSQVITKRVRVSRRAFLKGVTLSGTAIQVGLPPLVSMFNSQGTAYAAGSNAAAKVANKAIESRFVFWFNGNGIPERYWIPSRTGRDFDLPPCLSPLASFRNDIHVLTGLDNSAASVPGPGNGHHKSISGVTTATPFTGHGAGGPSIDQVIASKIGTESRFRSLQIGVSQESFGESIQRNMSWAGYNRPLPPEMLPHKLFDRLFGEREEGWVNRKRSILDAVREDALYLQKTLPKDDATRVEEHLSAIRDIERAITGLPDEYRRVEAPEYDGDMKDWPRIAKLQSDLLAQALVTRQTRVASYMLTKGQGLSRFPWLGLTAARHHDYTHADGLAPGADGADGQRVLRDICRWHVEEFAYLLAKLRSIPEGDGTVLDHTCLLYAHEHAEANPHKNSGLAMIVAGHTGSLATGMHTKVTGTVGDLYLTLADNVLGAGVGKFPTATRTMTQILAKS
ncbi:MAG TPA: DUF1552 domain-containing protein [Bryobacteraceae bacterium]|nr:DUF1552 domain-containing protein [Bryobacteraceae bacterium]